MYSIFAAVGVKRKRKSIKKQRELNEYWREHKQDEQLKHKDK
jgi:HAE1 family hydrophobic/amphiphilic exporter-1